MAVKLNDNGEFAAEINITPLVDVVLVLLIIFMMIVPVMMRGYDMTVPGEAPAAQTAPDPQRPKQIVLAIEVAECPLLEPLDGPGLPAGCTVTFDDEPLPVAALPGRVGDAFADRAADDRVLFLAAQPRLNYEGVMRIVDLARSGVDGLRIGLLTDG